MKNHQIHENWQQTAHEYFYLENKCLIPKNSSDSLTGSINIGFSLYCIYDPGYFESDKTGYVINVNLTIMLCTLNNVFYLNDSSPQFCSSIEVFTISAEQRSPLNDPYINCRAVDKKDYVNFYDFILKSIEPSFKNSLLHTESITFNPKDVDYIIKHLTKDMAIILDGIKNQQEHDSGQITLLKYHSNYEDIEFVAQHIVQEDIKHKAHTLANKVQNVCTHHSSKSQIKKV